MFATSILVWKQKRFALRLIYTFDNIVPSDHFYMDYTKRAHVRENNTTELSKISYNDRMDIQIYLNKTTEKK